ncbi:hypothetical protein H0A36_29600 [Endozoicomonas sp. SM1973]|uniref:Leucine-rich repeat domain-containing protein n=1 Tax=Spartinivicinus marinus TaxID=2994442 RepID=A0A853IJA6_9GAMM|nr:hypothetical protein [Spartinivicinus marinus]
MDLSNNPMLENLQLTWNKLKLLDVSHNPKLRILLAAQNELGAVNISNNPVLHALNLSDNKLGLLSAPNSPLLEYFHASNNKLHRLYLSSHHPILKEVTLHDNQIVSIDLPGQVRYITLYGNPLDEEEIEFHKQFDYELVLKDPMIY